MHIQTLNDESAFHAFVKESEARAGYKRPAAFAVGIARYSPNHPDKVLDVFYRQPNREQNYGSCAIFAAATDYLSGNRVIPLDQDSALSIRHGFAAYAGKPGHGNVAAFHNLLQKVNYHPDSFLNQRLVATFIEDLSAPPETVEDVYLRLHLLSHRLAKPNTMNLEGAFGILHNVVWTSKGPILPEEVPDQRIARWGEEGYFIRHEDKFPYMLDYVTHPDLRVTAAHCARLGAYLGPNTVIMPSGFVNFNAGTEENCMIEGRVSQGVWIGANSDIGGGASTMGTLSGGGTERVAVGRNCLIGANAGIGIALGDECTVEAGLYVTAGMKVSDVTHSNVVRIHAHSFSGKNRLLFRRNSMNGSVEVLRNEKPNKPNTILHTND